MMRSEIVVVEGTHDKQRLESVYPGIECIVTGGSEISEATLSLIQQAAQNRGVILFMDPDHSGRKITNRILEKIDQCKIAFISVADARSKNRKKVGIEHARAETIKNSLEHLFEIQPKAKAIMTYSELCQNGLAGKTGSKVRRYQVCEALHLPQANGKTFLRLIQMLSVSRKAIEEVMK